ncbi:hypothetical protein A2392_03190 [Candidatus Kaiserbacteria bacterium RIFOXYB1_FULL_46_14]|uniref:Uncharacterized protein n=1 Tax=Candidatus Kaiserbacteria bacterium RIFOXYB1_FULL_46_14 TaxID=1798531 RepID=A0A1F6FJF6_9BACT|nr:MAG: hypothetical protein A2392_03190 [Candidatus Kaiserbacteria bacterium RIFOXYB1_FULL_46_14]
MVFRLEWESRLGKLKLTEEEKPVKKILSIFTAAVLVATFSALPASAADVDININTGASDMLQLNIGGALALDEVIVDQTNAINIATVVGEEVEDVNVNQAAGNILQGNLALAVGFDPASVVTTTQTNALNVLSASLDTKGWSDINITQSASGIIQGNLGLVAGGSLVDLSQVNAANVIDLSVNVD